MLIAVQAAVAAAIGLLYLARAFALRGGGESPCRWRIACFCGGIAVLIAATAALEGPGREQIYPATLEQLLIGDVAALLIALGLTESVLSPLRSIWGVRALRHAALPSVALCLWIANTALWHVPAAFEATLHHRSLMLVEHVLLAACGIVVWLALLGPGATERWRARHGRWIAYAIFWRALAVGLGTSGIVSPDVFYLHYISTDVAFTTSPLSDQGIAGCIMIGESAIAAIGLLLYMYFQAGSEGDAELPPSSATPARETGSVARRRAVEGAAVER